MRSGQPPDNRGAQAATAGPGAVPDSMQIEELARVLAGGGARAQEEAARELGKLGNSRAMMVLYDFVRDDGADPGARQVAADELVRLGLLRRERTGPSFAF